jgi:hypothetical protein
VTRKKQHSSLFQQAINVSLNPSSATALALSDICCSLVRSPADTAHAAAAANDASDRDSSADAVDTEAVAVTVTIRNVML